MNGNDGLIVPAMIAGARGGGSGTANIVPSLGVSIYQSMAVGDIEKA
jgi:dihydrodipicolinate synthase/N-acetylneuraminate lyase